MVIFWKSKCIIGYSVSTRPSRLYSSQPILLLLSIYPVSFNWFPSLGSFIVDSWRPRCSQHVLNPPLQALKLLKGGSIYCVDSSAFTVSWSFTAKWPLAVGITKYCGILSQTGPRLCLHIAPLILSSFCFQGLLSFVGASRRADPLIAVREDSFRVHLAQLVTGRSGTRSGVPEGLLP